MNLKSVSPQAPPYRASAFTLTELLFAMGIVGIVCVSLFAGLAQSFKSLQSARHRLRATQILAERLEVIRLYSWTQVNTPGFVPTTFTEYHHPETNSPSGGVGIVYKGTVTITDAPVHPAYASTMRKVTVQIGWDNQGIPQQQTIETLISEYGIQNYIY